MRTYRPLHATSTRVFICIFAVTLSGSGDFRGLLVQARSIADNSPVGSFENISALTRLSSCNRADVCISFSVHTQQTNKYMILLLSLPLLIQAGWIRPVLNFHSRLHLLALGLFVFSESLHYFFYDIYLLTTIFHKPQDNNGA